MQKKLYFLDEDEKNRILNLHESATKKQYLLGEEQKTSSFDPLAKVKSTFTDIERQVGEVPKGILTKTELDEFKKIKPQWDMAKPVGKACKTLKNVDLRIVDTPEQIGQIVNEIYTKFEDSGHSLYMNKSVSLSMGESLSKFKSIPDLCYGIKISSAVIPVETDIKQWMGTSVNDNFLKLFWDIYHSQSGGGFTSTDTATAKKAIYEPLQKIIKASEIGQVQTKSPEEETKEPSKTLVGWDKYPCVMNNPNKKEGKMKDGTSAFLIDDFWYYGGGRRMNTTTKEMSNYYCIDENTIGEGSPQVVGGQANVEPKQQSSGIGVVTRNVQNEIPILLKQAGLEGQPINQDTINKLYDILSKK